MLPLPGQEWENGAMFMIFLQTLPHHPTVCCASLVSMHLLTICRLLSLGIAIPQCPQHLGTFCIQTSCGRRLYSSVWTFPCPASHHSWHWNISSGHVGNPALIPRFPPCSQGICAQRVKLKTSYPERIVRGVSQIHPVHNWRATKPLREVFFKGFFWLLF